MIDRELVGLVAFGVAALILGLIVFDTYNRGKPMGKRKDRKYEDSTQFKADLLDQYADGRRDGRNEVLDTLETAGAMERRHEPSGLVFQVAVVRDELAVSIIKGRSATGVFFPLDKFTEMIEDINRRPE